MTLTEALGIEKGVTAVIGSGGKTTLLHCLAKELSQQGSVILTTSTHIRPSEEYPCLYSPTADELKAFFERGQSRAVCIGTATEDGKFAVCDIPFEDLAMLADYVLVEADGSKMLPLKAHAPHEPVIPANAGRTVCVVGASGLNRPIREAVHRPELFCRAVNATPAERATPVFVAWFLNLEDLADIYFINQCDLPNAEPAAKELAELLCKPAVCGSLWQNRE